MFDDQKEQVRLFQIGLKAARDLVEGMKSRTESPLSQLPKYMPGASADFVLGMMYSNETTKAYDEIVKYDNGVPRKDWLAPSEAKKFAQLSYRKSNCSLIK